MNNKSVFQFVSMIQNMCQSMKKTIQIECEILDNEWFNVPEAAVDYFCEYQSKTIFLDNEEKYKSKNVEN